ncbi:hypothetical protein JCM33374_g1201 [Metschnikowia sp. JCM 33374]|nr:hypothetical protein JCM33374_g1201 [Metschnikowia sp. JCM 33374]
MKDSLRLRTLQEKLEKHEQSIASSGLFTHTISALKPLQFTKIRCLALGSPTSEFQALYQLAYLKLIALEFNIDAEQVSLYDPAFSNDDTYFLSTELHYVIESPENFCPDLKSTSQMLYYMPHSPRSLTETILTEFKPRWFLANDFSVTMGTLTKAKFLSELPNLANLVHLYEKQKGEKNMKNTHDNQKGKPDEDSNNNDGFAPVVSRRRRNRPKNIVYVEPELVYDSQNTYFCGLEIERIQGDANAPWKDSFSDLALNVIIPKKDNENSLTATDQGKEKEKAEV